MKSPLVSVVMATFNEPKEYVTKAIESILSQTYSNIELLILDDSTSVETIEAIDSMHNSDNRVIVVRELNRMGFVPALNKGLQLAKGEYIARMDGDDISLPERFEKQVRFLQTHSDIDILGGCINIINSKDEIVSSRKYPSSKWGIKLMTAYRNPLAHPSVIFRRKIVDQGLLYNQNQKYAEDLEFWLRLRNKSFRITNIEESILNWRLSQNMASKRNSEQFQYNLKARIDNFSWNNCLFDIVSIIIVSIYVWLPKRVVSKMYSKENNN